MRLLARTTFEVPPDNSLTLTLRVHPDAGKRSVMKLLKRQHGCARGSLAQSRQLAQGLEQ